MSDYDRRTAANATHYLAEWPEGVGDQLCYNDDVWGGVEEWIEQLVEDYYDESEGLRSYPRGRLLAECSRFVSLRSRLDGSAHSLADSWLERETPALLVDAHYLALHAALCSALEPALAALPEDQGWYEISGQHVYITAGELLAIIEEDA